MRRVVFIVETNREKDGNELEKIRSLFGGKSKDFVTAVDEKNIIVVKELAENETYDDLRKTAEVILNLFRSEADGVHIAYGTVINELKEVSRSYKEARMALDVGKSFRGEEYYSIFPAWNRPSDISAPDSSMQDVYQRDIRWQIP